MTLKIILPGQALSFFARTLGLTPHAAEAVASAVVVVDRTVVRPPAGSLATVARPLSGRLDTGVAAW